MSSSMEDRIVVVTGAGGRLGQRLVGAYTDAGATVAGVDQRAEDIPAPAGATVDTYGADLTSERSVTACFAEIADAHGRIDVLIHTVGMWGMAPFHETSLEDWRTMMDVNLTSAFLCFREGVKHMRAHGGQIIGMASAQGADGGAGQQPGYSAAKAGIVRLVEAITEEYADDEITAHAIAPSMLLFGEEEPGTAGVAAEHIVDLALYLSDPARGQALNGSVLRAYGTMQ